MGDASGTLTRLGNWYKGLSPIGQGLAIGGGGLGALATTGLVANLLQNDPDPVLTPGQVGAEYNPYTGLMSVPMPDEEMVDYELRRLNRMAALNAWQAQVLQNANDAGMFG